MKQDEAPTVAFVTDFGRRDVYVAEMHAVLLEICPLARIIDITHEIPSGDIGSAAYIVGRMKNRLPARSVCVAVVDPGVGTTRQGVALECDGRYFIGPDNGIFSQVVTSDSSCRVRILDCQDALTSACANTFHGRDLFTPVAGRLATGCSLEQIGRVGSLLNTPPAEPPKKLKDGWLGRIIYIDSFGNIITNIANYSHGFVRIGDFIKIPRAENYADQPPDVPFWLEGSGGTIEISMNRESAAERLELKLGAPVWFLEES